MNSGTVKIVLKGKEVYLKDTDFKARGGQGTVYLKNGLIYKIYHDINMLIPEQKIYELQTLKEINEIVMPDSSIYDTLGQRIGFTLKYVENSEYLCKLFSTSFKNRNKINTNTVSNIIDKMRCVTIEIHNRGIVIGDYNDMNILIGKTFNGVYYIDAWPGCEFAILLSRHCIPGFVADANRIRRLCS